MQENRKDRLEAIVRLVGQRSISSQEELRSLLMSNGHEVTLSTLSRDIKALRMSRMPDGLGGYRYTLPDRVGATHTEVANGKKNLGVVGIEVSGQMSIVKTLPGYAAMVASRIDAERLPGIMGTIAGDDTVFIALRNETDEESMRHALGKILQ